VTHIRPRLEDAAYRGHADIYLDENHTPGDLKFMRATCASCPEVTPCLDYAMRRETFGFWAGTTAPERRKLREEHGTGLEPIHVGPHLAGSG
jgi:hypothetical protein